MKYDQNYFIMGQQARIYMVMILVLLPSAISAQVSFQERFELEKHTQGASYFVVPLARQGVLLLRDTEDSNKGGIIWEAQVLDTAFVVSWDTTFSVDWNYSFRGYEIKDKHLYLLYTEGQTNRSDFHIMKLDLESGGMETFDIKNGIDIQISHMIVINDKLVLGGYIIGRPSILLYDQKEERVKVIPGFFQRKSDILEIKVNPDRASFNVLVSEKRPNGLYVIHANTYDDTGYLVYEHTVALEDNLKVLAARSTDTSEEGMAIAGTYGNDNSFFSNGIFFVNTKEEESASLKYYDFSDLEHFFDFMNPRRASRLKDKIVKKKQKGRGYRFNSRLLPHVFTPSKEGYLFMAEVYEPNLSYRTASTITDPYLSANTNYSSTSKYVRQPSRLSHVQDANSFTFYQSTIVNFDEYGSVLWDESFDIKDIEKISLDRVMALRPEKNKIEVLYKQHDALVFGELDQGKVLQEDSVYTIKVSEREELVSNNPYSEDGAAMYWYDDYFLVWGYQRLESTPTRERKNVFFINKVHFE